MAKLGYAAYVKGSNGCTRSVQVGDTTLSASAHMTFERCLLRDERGAVARFDASKDAEAASAAARWNNQVCGSIPVAHLRKGEYIDGFVDVSGAVTS